MNNRKMKKAAGVILTQAYPGKARSIEDIKFLSLKTDGKSRWCHHEDGRYGVWDVPKGIIEPGELQIEAAIRETKEETNLVVNEDYKILEHRSIDCGFLTLFLGVRLSGARLPKLVANPESGVVEHTSWGWISLKEFYEVGIPTLVEPVEKALKMIETVYLK